MPVYTYRREDGSTFDYKQKFLDDPLEVDPETGQKVVRVIHNPGIIFKGSGFYVTDSKKSSSTSSKSHSEKSNGSSAESKSESKTETTAEAKTESKTESKAEAKTEKAGD
jgi:predicted nucleic acid-binding Zn ribbon protein